MRLATEPFSRSVSVMTKWREERPAHRRRARMTAGTDDVTTNELGTSNLRFEREGRSPGASSTVPRRGTRRRPPCTTASTSRPRRQLDPELGRAHHHRRRRRLRARAVISADDRAGRRRARPRRRGRPSVPDDPRQSGAGDRRRQRHLPGRRTADRHDVRHRRRERPRDVSGPRIVPRRSRRHVRGRATCPRRVLLPHAICCFRHGSSTPPRRSVWASSPAWSRTTSCVRPRSRRRIRSCSPRRGARAHVKRMLNERYGFIDMQTMFAALGTRARSVEGMRAFMEKRPPTWVPPGIEFEGRR